MSIENKFQNLKEVYMILSIQILITFITTKWMRDNQIILGNSIWFPIIFSFIFLFMILYRKFSQTTRWISLILFSICLGLTCIASSKYFSIEMIQKSLLSVICLFMLMSLVGYILYSQNISLQPLQLIMIFVLLGLIVGWITLMFMKPTELTSKWVRTMFIIGFIVFSLLIAIDTNRILFHKDPKTFDALSESLSLYLDIMNLFQNILGLQR
jgi:FtsH-binding integral membrane protein